ncbi:predicted protein [Naegleria gruberi]|uniref:Predicted protein n=1 Tax=Naegleria gruberi TaxID=5762 RepID=D2VNI0_NAEGR|nr:uncharacterized protein NAEGRDRAFT_70507 [Naegleria gruberi]EFC41665.1 predicted protein [Naegleria gruberi]|eukprot:XP_002674409.1 predicted protein [Naegleria gruberi strain NEG-M]
MPFRDGYSQEFRDCSLCPERYINFQIKPSCCTSKCTKTTCEIIKYLVMNVYESELLVDRQASCWFDGYYVRSMHWLAHFGQLSLVRFLVNECGFKAQVQSDIDWVSDWSINQAFIEKHFDLVREMCKGDYSFMLRDRCDHIPAGMLYSCFEMIKMEVENTWDYWLFIVEECLRGKITDEILDEAMETWDRKPKDFLRAKQDLCLRENPIRSHKQLSDIIFEFEL